MAKSKLRFEDEKHDLLLITPKGEYHRFPVETAGDDSGSFVRAPTRPDMAAAGSRKILNLARRGHGDSRRGPAFALLPVKPEPAGSACGLCYLVNAENLRAHNPWVSAAWNDSAIADAPASAEADEFEVLIAGPAGKVYHVQKHADAEQPSVRRVDMSGESEIWSQLRNGCIAGAAEYTHHPAREPRVVPLVNVTSLTPDDE